LIIKVCCVLVKKAVITNFIHFLSNVGPKFLFLAEGPRKLGYGPTVLSCRSRAVSANRYAYVSTVSASNSSQAIKRMSRKREAMDDGDGGNTVSNQRSSLHLLLFTFSDNEHAFHLGLAHALPSYLSRHRC
jgi:hypothetical protein